MNRFRNYLLPQPLPEVEVSFTSCNGDCNKNIARHVIFRVCYTTQRSVQLAVTTALNAWKCFKMSQMNGWFGMSKLQKMPKVYQWKEAATKHVRVSQKYISLTQSLSSLSIVSLLGLFGAGLLLNADWPCQSPELEWVS